MSRMRGGLALTMLLVVSGWVPASRADATTRCTIGGPAGTSRVIRLELPAGSDFLNVALFGSRTPRPAGTTDSWHLASGVFVIDEATSELLSYRIASEGSSTRRTVVEVDGTRHVDTDTPGPDTPFIHSRLANVKGLAPGSYLIVGFGSDGDRAAPNDGWGGHVEVAGSHRCSALTSGEIFDVNHADFEGGTQVSTFGTALVRGATLERYFDGDLVVGLMDASTHIAGEATLDYEMPGSAAGTVDDDIQPFVAPGGSFGWTADVSGVAPIISIAGLVVDLP